MNFNINFNRRNFIKVIGATTALSATGLGINSLFSGGMSNKKILVHVLLEGGPDWRHMLVPPFSDQAGSYSDAYWTNRKNVHVGRFFRGHSMKDRYRNDYIELSGGNLGKFGILKKAGWLADQYKKGNAAIINNVQHSLNRNHSWSLIITQTGDMSAQESQADRDGWGGRLATAMNSNILSMSGNVLLYCNPPEGRSRNMIYSAHDSRNFGLYEPDIFFDKNEKSGSNPERYNSPRAKMHRALSSYYKEKNKVEQRDIYRRFFEHEQKLRRLGQSVKANLDKYPDYFHGIPAGGSRKDRQESLKKFNVGKSYLDSGFGLQLRSLYDSIVSQDIIQFNVASLDMNGWDSHKLQQDYIEPKINQIFGSELLDNGGKPISGKSGGLKTLMELIPKNRHKDIVFVFSGDFGRQLKANGGRGTDHGRGNSIIVVGDSVNGGMYGDLFPQSEAKRFYADNQDNEGKTGIDYVYGAVCDWMGGHGNSVFPNRKSAPVEAGMLDKLFKA